MNKENAKKILKGAMLIYLASFLIINWNDVSWIFNYKAVTGLASDFFNPYPSIDAATIDNYFYPNHSLPMQSGQEVAGSPEIKNAKTIYTDKQNTLEIPKINITVPIIFAKSTDKASLMKDLNLGATYYPGSVYPGEVGQIVILGHSAPPGWPTIKHDWIFSNIEKLEIGDSVMIDLNNRQYTYIVKQKKIIQRGADIPHDNLNANNNILTLISCWPPGKDYQRITVEAELVVE
jgi:LPXTG-site transpeptidase (sortase) family protein